MLMEAFVPLLLLSQQIYDGIYGWGADICGFIYLNDMLSLLLSVKELLCEFQTFAIYLQKFGGVQECCLNFLFGILISI